MLHDIGSFVHVQFFGSCLERGVRASPSGTVGSIYYAEREKTLVTVVIVGLLCSVPFWVAPPRPPFGMRPLASALDFLSALHFSESLPRSCFGFIPLRGAPFLESRSRPPRHSVCPPCRISPWFPFPLGEVQGSGAPPVLPPGSVLGCLSGLPFGIFSLAAPLDYSSFPVFRISPSFLFRIAPPRLLFWIRLRGFLVLRFAPPVGFLLGPSLERGLPVSPLVRFWVLPPGRGHDLGHSHGHQHDHGHHPGHGHGQALGSIPCHTVSQALLGRAVAMAIMPRASARQEQRQAQGPPANFGGDKSGEAVGDTLRQQGRARAFGALLLSLTFLHPIRRF